MELSSTAASDTLKQRSALFILKSTTLCPITATSPLPMHTLLPRQSQSILSYVAPDDTVGYIDGRVGAPVTCYGGECVASAGTIGGCYDSNHCTYSGVCIDAAAFSTSSACPYGCQQDPNTIKCTGGARLCQPYTVPALTAIMFTCVYTLVPTITLETNPNGQNPVRVWSTAYAGAATGTSTTSLKGSTTSSNEFASPTGTSTGSSGNSGTSTDSSEQGPSTGSAGTGDTGLSTKTIVIIAVAGFILVAALVWGGIWYYRRKKRRAEISHYPQPQMGYGFPTPPSLIPPPQSYGLRPPNPGSQSYGAVQNHDYFSPASDAVSPVSNSPPPPPGRFEIDSPPPPGRFEVDSTANPSPYIAELGPGRYESRNY